MTTETEVKTEKQLRLERAVERAHLRVIEAQRDVATAEYGLKNSQALKLQAEADLLRFLGEAAGE